MEGKRSQEEAAALPTPRPAARLEGISKRFGATQALERIGRHQMNHVKTIAFILVAQQSRAVM